MINKFQTGGTVNNSQQGAAGEQQELIRFCTDMAQIGTQMSRQQIAPEQVMQMIQQAINSGQQDLVAQAYQVWRQGDARSAAGILFEQAQAARKGAKLNYLKKITNTCPEGTQLTYYKVGGQICSKCEAIAKQQKAINVMDSIKAEIFQKGGQTKQPNKKKEVIFTKEDDAKRLKYKTQGNVLNTKTYTTYSRNTPEEKRDSTRLEQKWKNATNKKDFKDVEEDKKGAKISAKACPKCGKVHAGKCGSKLMKKKKKCACGTKLDAKKCGGKAVSKKPMDKCGAKLKEMKCGAKMKKAKKHELGGILEAMQKFAKGGSLKGIPFKS